MNDSLNRAKLSWCEVIAMYGDCKYRFDEAEGSDNNNTLLTEGKCKVVRKQKDATSADTCTLTKVDTVSPSSPVHFMTSHPNCRDKETDIENADWSRDLAGHGDIMAIVGSEKAGHVTGCVDDDEMSEKNNVREISRSYVDETASFTNHSMVCEAHEDVDWSELASARSALKLSLIHI